MIPGSILSFLESEAMVAIAASRDESNTPHLHRVSGWSIEADGETINCFIPDAFTAHLDYTLAQNGEFALTAEQLGSHKTYQFKGVCVRSRSVTDDDLAVSERLRAQFAEALEQAFGMPVEASRGFVLPPALVLQLKVSEIFLQTPGPEAGQRVFPAEDV